MSSTGYLTYVSEMLSTHDAVVIPGFGGFITKYKPARISTEADRIFPPTKYIAFNDQLDIHDNTFARFLDENTSAHYSPRLFDHFIAELKSDLAGNQVIVVPNVGRLYQDFEGETHFMPDLLNLNNDTYGLPEVSCRKGDWYSESVLRKAATELKGGSMRMALSSAATVALLFLLVWVGADSLTIKDDRTAEFGIGEVITKEKSGPSPKKEEPASIEQKVDLTKADPIEESIISEVDPSQKAIIIVGAFGSNANAAKMMNEITSLGYMGYQDKPNKLNRVGLEVSYTSQEEIDSILSNVQKRITSRAWILK